MVEIKDPENYFYTCNGEVLHDVDEMFLFIKSAQDSILTHHFNSERNDFANWTREILKKKALAKKIEGAKTRNDLIAILQGELERSGRKKMTKKNIIFQIKEAINND